MDWFVILLAVLFVILCVIIILVILIQPGQSEGLAGTFGSGGMLGSAFGVHMKNRLAKFTTIMVILFFTIIFIFAFTSKTDDEEDPLIKGTKVKSSDGSSEPAPSDTPDSVKPDGSLSPDTKETVPEPDATPNEKESSEEPAQKTEKD